MSGVINGEGRARTGVGVESNEWGVSERRQPAAGSVSKWAVTRLNARPHDVAQIKGKKHIAVLGQF